MTTACIVQARVGSSRLPNKVMQPLAGESVLSHVLRRCKAVAGVDVVVCATVDEPACDALAAEAVRCGAVVYRGSERDVLDRYTQAARMVGAEAVLRVTSDCPVFDVDLAAAVVAVRKAGDFDYTCVNMPPQWPHGLDVEGISLRALERAWREARAPEEREHVSPWIRNHPDTTKAVVTSPDPSLRKHRWTLDFPEDYAFFQALMQHLPAAPALPNWRDVLAVVEAYPEIAALNAMHNIHQ